jgi:hypothetical protein
MAHHIFSSKANFQNIPEAAPEASRSFSISEKLARYGSSGLSGVEHPRRLPAWLTDLALRANKAIAGCQLIEL